MDILPDKARAWTFEVHLVTDTYANLAEAPLVRVGTGRLDGNHLFVELVPGISVSGSLMLKLKD
ncbi:MAG TPA: hypothetical protein VHU23_16505 [Rhizomicrobium sp.]|jgi:hypothetical protein|nr:hypothetical protein [Rhizomicrobium sp.]